MTKNDREDIARRLFAWLAAGSPEPKPSGLPDALYFKTCADAFDYACRYLKSELRKDTVLPSIVDLAKAPEGGTQKCAIRVLHGDSPLSTISLTLNETVPLLRAGDLVAFHIVEYDQSSPLSVMNPVGFITAKLKPEFNLMKGWAVARE